MKIFMQFLGILFISCSPSMTISGKLSNADKIRQQLVGGYFECNQYYGMYEIKSILKLYENKFKFSEDHLFISEGTWIVSDDGKYLILDGTSRLEGVVEKRYQMIQNKSYEFRIKNTNTLVLEGNNLHTSDTYYKKYKRQ